MVFQVIIRVCDQHSEEKTLPQFQDIPVWQHRHLPQSISDIGVVPVGGTFFSQCRTGRQIWQPATSAAIKALNEADRMPAGRQFKPGLRCSNAYRARHCEGGNFQPFDGPCIIN